MVVGNIDIQALFNVSVGVIGSIGGWWFHTMWTAMRALQADNQKLADRIADIEVLVAGNYVKRSDFDRFVENLFHKLDKIEDKINGKEDRSQR